MKPKNFTLVAITVAIVCIGLWWFTRPRAVIPEKTAQAFDASKANAPALSKVEAPRPIVPSNIAPPIAPPAPKSGSAPIAATAPSIPKADPQADLKTAVLDIARLIRDGGDPEAFLVTYTPPDKLDPQRIQEIQMGMQNRTDMGVKDPFMRRMTQDLTELYAKGYESLENQTPTYNDAGDEATYMLTFVYPDGYSNQSSKTFVKINGKWYLKSD
jgi:hypothetical protein